MLHPPTNIPLLSRIPLTMSLLYKITDSPIVKAATAINDAVVLNPLVTGLVLLLLTNGTENTRNYLRQAIATTSLTESTVKTALAVLTGLGIVRYVNRKLSDLASNSFRLGAAPGWDWPREVAVVTGGSSGIGLAIVERFARKGIKVAVLDVQDLPKSVQSSTVRFYKCDVTSPKSVAEAADAVRRDFGHPSILINNAGITKPVSILDMPDDFLQKIFGVNTISHWTLVKQFAPAMVKKNKGHIVTVASVASFVALPGGVDYSCTKASALAFHEGLAAELKVIYKAPNVLVSVIHPNFVATPLIADFKDRLTNGGVTFLTTDRVADEIVNQVYKKKSAQVIIPGTSAILTGLRGFPTWLQVFIRDAAAKGTIHN